MVEDALYEVAELYIGKDNVKTVIEAGALNCKDSLTLSKQYPNAHIYAFECNPDSIEVCKKNIQGSDHITLTEKALTDKEGDVVFFPIDTKKTETPHEDGNPGASSMFLANQEYPMEKYVQGEISVPSTTLKRFLADSNLDSVDILRLDAQGSELSILKGLEEMINKVKVIQTEVLFKPQYLNAPLFDEVTDYLESKGFRFAGYATRYEWFGDVLFVRENL